MAEGYKHIYLFLIAVVFTLYGKGITHDFAVDDKAVITRNTNIQKGFEAIPSIFSNTICFGYVDPPINTAYRPITLSSFAVETGFFGVKAGVHHFFNILYYAMLCCLLFLLLNTFLFHGYSVWFSFMIVLFYAVHPIHTEVVSNIKSRDEILCFLLFTASAVFMFKYLKSKKAIHLMLSCLLYFFDLMTKETACSFIALFPAMLWCFSGFGAKKIFKVTIPYIIVLGLFLFIRWLVIRDIYAEFTYWDNGLLAFTNLFERYGLTFFILLLYFKLLIFPHPLLWDYSYGHFHPDNKIMALGALSIVIYICLIIYVIAGLKKRTLLSFAAILFLVPLVIVSNVFFSIGSTMGERFLFVPSLGFCMAIIVFAGKIFKVNFTFQKVKICYSMKVAFAFTAILFSIKTFSRNNSWKNDYTIITTDYGVTKSYRSRLSFIEVMYARLAEEADKGLLLSKMQNEVTMLIVDFPAEPEAWYLHALVHTTLGQNEVAEKSYIKTISIDKGHLKARNNLGIFYHQKGDLEKAIQLYNSIIEIDRSFAPAYANIGLIYHISKNYNEAKRYYELAIQYEPGNPTFRENYNKLMNEMKQ